MNYEQAAGVLRIFLPVILAYAVGRGWVPESAVADITAAVLAVAAAIWAVAAHTETNTIRIVAGMQSTEVSQNGKQITINDPGMAAAAKASSTPPVKP